MAVRTKQTVMNQMAKTPRNFAWQGEMSEHMCSAFFEDGYLVIEDFFRCGAVRCVEKLMPRA